jgi:hypothetical protein
MVGQSFLLPENGKFIRVVLGLSVNPQSSLALLPKVRGFLRRRTWGAGGT